MERPRPERQHRTGIPRRTALAALAAFGLALGGAPALAQFSDGYLFIKAVKDRDALKAKNMIDKPGSTVIDIRDRDSGETALTLTVQRRDAPWIAFLLQNGANPDGANRNSDTPLIIAARNGYADGVRLLLLGKANVNLANSRGETALIKAVQGRDAQVVDMLLKADADPDQPDNLTGMSARQYATEDPRAGRVGEMMTEAAKKGPAKTIGPHF